MLCLRDPSSQRAAPDSPPGPRAFPVCAGCRPTRAAAASRAPRLTRSGVTTCSHLRNGTVTSALAGASTLRLMLKTPLAMAGALCALLVSAPLAVAASPATLAVIGDTPYGQPQIDQFPGDVAEINADPAVSRVIHLGDIKNGSSRCDTSYFRLIRSDFDGFADPLVYTPGDNEWTDCYRANNGGYQPAGPTPAGARAGRAGRPRAHFFYPPPPT